MNNSEKAKKILESEEIPENLRPENIKKMLDSERYVNKRYRKPDGRQYTRIVAGLAACAMFSTVSIYAIEKNAPDKNLVIQSEDDTMGTAENNDIKNDTETASGKNLSIRSAESYDEIYDIVSKAPQYAFDEYEGGGIEKSSDFSKTYNQEEGVCESDRTVTDGRCIFSAVDNNINVALVDNGEFLYKYSFDVTLPDVQSVEVKDMYILDESLIIVSEMYNFQGENFTNILSYSIGYTAEKFSGKYPVVLAYQGEYSQGGAFSDIRVIDDYIYLITSDDSYVSDKNLENYDTYLPKYYINGRDKNYIEPENIYIPENPREFYNSYTVIGALKFNSENSIFIEKDIKAFLKSNEIIYCSKDNLYVTMNDYLDLYTQNTDIFRFSLSEGSITPESDTNIKGIPINQFSMSEYNGYFRIAVSYTEETAEEWNTSEGSETVSQSIRQNNAVYIFDMNMNQVGMVTDFGIDENIKSVNFCDDMGYVVTYEQTDPVFAIDLSIPENPVITDSIELTGYSTYMQKWSDNLLLGFGVSADENGFENGFKLVMFDVSDKNNIQEISRLEFIKEDSDESEQFLGSPAFNDRKALLIAPEKNIIGIPYYIQRTDRDFMTLGYEFYSFEKNEFYYIGTVSDYMNECYGMDRAVYIDDYIYVICENKFISFSIPDGKTLSECAF